MEGVAAAGILTHRRRGSVAIADFADSDSARIFIKKRPYPFEKDKIFRLGLVVDMLLETIRVGIRHVMRRRALGRRIVAQLGVVEIVVAGIEPKSVHPAIEPEAHRLDQGIANFGRMEIDVRLRCQEAVHIILHPHPVPFPGWAPEDRQPVVGRGAVGLGIGPHIPVGFGIIAACAALLEPFMLVGSVAEHLIDDDPEAQLMRTGEHRVEIGESPEHRIDIAIVGHVIAHVRHRRLEEGRHPDRIDAERGDVVEPRGYALEIADPVSVAILERARVNLVDDRAAPPITILGVDHDIAASSTR